jgi:hypothetical protein
LREQIENGRGEAAQTENEIEIENGHGGAVQVEKPD